MKKYNLSIFGCLAGLFLLVAGCQKMDRPGLGSYDADYTFTPTTPLRFYLPFDSTEASQKQLNIRFRDDVSKYPSLFPGSGITATSGVTGTAFYSAGSASLGYVNANDFLATSKSFTIAFWSKHNGLPKGAEVIFNFPSSAGYWTGSTMWLFQDEGSGATVDDAVFKFVINDKTGDNFFVWDGTDRVHGIQDNKWHHIAFVYNHNTSLMTLYVDGAALPNPKSWGTHGALNVDVTKLKGFTLGANPDLGWTSMYKGGLDQFRLYNTALTSAEVANLFTNKL